MSPVEPYPIPAYALHRCIRVAEVLIQNPRISRREIERRTGFDSDHSLELFRARYLIECEQGSGVRPSLFSLSREGQIWFAGHRDRLTRLDGREPILQAPADDVQDG